MKVAFGPAPFGPGASGGENLPKSSEPTSRIERQRFADHRPNSDGAIEALQSLIELLDAAFVVGGP